MADTTQTSAGPLNGLERNDYQTTDLVYPSDLENQAHLIQFNIYVPTTSAAAQSQTQGAGGTTQVGQQSVGANGYQALGQTSAQQQNTTLTQSQKITTTIQLYSPQTMIFDTQAQWDNTPILPLLTQAGTTVAEIGAGAAALGLAKGGRAGAILGLGGEITGALGGLGAAGIGALTSQLGNALLYGKAGYVVNPVIQVIYIGPSLREFQFDFEFAPRSMEEATAVKQIVQTLRAYSSPDYSSLSLGQLGGLFIPPATFDIMFFRSENGSFSENQNIPRISRCALKDINVNYAPENQWVTYKDGFPVHTTLRLAFQELQVITNDLITNQGF
jgi:hypothetical protein